jgi:hypothetical protein
MRNVRRLEGLVVDAVDGRYDVDKDEITQRLDARTAWVVLRRLYRTKDAQKLAAVTQAGVTLARQAEERVAERHAISVPPCCRVCCRAAHGRTRRGAGYPIVFPSWKERTWFKS